MVVISCTMACGPQEGWLALQQKMGYGVGREVAWSPHSTGARRGFPVLPPPPDPAPKAEAGQRQGSDLMAACVRESPVKAFPVRQHKWLPGSLPVKRESTAAENTSCKILWASRNKSGPWMMDFSPLGRLRASRHESPRTLVFSLTG